ncbi:MAG TPA: hypothetical protein PLJ38_03020 [bacterium]|nr:hypothetical protein [bacterium]
MNKFLFHNKIKINSSFAKNDVLISEMYYLLINISAIIIVAISELLKISNLIVGILVSVLLISILAFI